MLTNEQLVAARHLSDVLKGVTSALDHGTEDDVNMALDDLEPVLSDKDNLVELTGILDASIEMSCNILEADRT